MNKFVKNTLTKAGKSMVTPERLKKSANNPIKQKLTVRDMRKSIETRYNAANTVEECDKFLAYIAKQKNLIQRRINGTYIEKKDFLYQIMNDLKTYEKKAIQKKSQLSNAKESFVNFCDRMFV